jgi:predicted aspartyl protease
MKVVFLLAAALAAIVPAFADDCPPLQLYASVQLQRSPDGDAEYVPVTINGKPQLLELDTGAESSILTAEAAKQLGLESHVGNFRIYTVTGDYSDQETTTSLQIGNLKSNGIRFVVAPEGVLPLDPGVAGLLGADLLGNLDVSIDFGTNKLDLINPNHCKGKVVYWPQRPLAIVPFEQPGTVHIIIPVTLDGHEMEAIVDTGASKSTLRRHRAETTFDLTMGASDTPAVGHVNGNKDVEMWRHTFKTLTLEGVTVANPELDIIPDRMSEHVAMGAETGSHINTRDEGLKPDILLGMNVLKHLHVYIAYKEQTLYITPASEPAPAK